MEEKRTQVKRRHGFQEFLKDNLGILVGLFVICVAIAVIQPNFIATKNIFNILRSISTTGIIGFGMTLCIIINGIDLSQGSVIGFSSCFCAWLLLTFQAPFWVGIVGGILIGLVCGLFNGFLLAYTPMPPFIVTLASQLVARGACYVITKGNLIYVDDAFGKIGNGYLFGFIPYPVLYLLVIFILMFLLLSKTKFGRCVYAIGGNREAARFSGIDIRKVTLRVYAISGALAGVCGIVACSRITQGSPVTGNALEFDAVAACYLGGISYLGGEGKIESTLIGAIVLGVIANGMSMLLIPWYVQNIVKGAIILIAVYFDVTRKNREAKAFTKA
ncbi:MAG: ABC transporter permease [Lachnospiraceae bacterium]|nr:ABC transporter permease [Lachnospiraceae bacterium]